MAWQKYFNAKRALIVSHLRVGVQKLECLLHLLFRGPASHVQEVGWFAALELDNIHGRHRQTRTVDCGQVDRRRTRTEEAEAEKVLVVVRVEGQEEKREEDERGDTSKNMSQKGQGCVAILTF